jgi:hypothetical protein
LRSIIRRDRAFTCCIFLTAPTLLPLAAEESKNLFLAFLDESKTKEGEAPTIDIFDFVNALNKHESTHPLDPFYKKGPSLG